MSLNNNGTDAVRRRKVANGNGTSSSSSQHHRKERRKKSSQRHSREENNNHKLVLVFLASFTTVGIILFLFLRSPSEVNSDNQHMRYEGGSGKPGLRKDTTVNYEGMRYLDPRQLPPLPGHPLEPYFGKGRKGGFRGEGDDEWQSNADAALSNNNNNNNNHDNLGPNVDYTKHTYEYPELMFEPPNDGTYPPLYEMSSIFETWGQDDLDNPPDTLVEVLQHFDYQNPEHLEVSSLHHSIMYCVTDLLTNHIGYHVGSNQV